MMKKLCFLIITSLFAPVLHGQELDSLLAILNKQKNTSDLAVLPEVFNNDSYSSSNSYGPGYKEPAKSITIKNQDDEKKRPSYRQKFKGHWAGFEWGLNNFLDEEHTVSREGDAWFMDLNTGRSWVINLNFVQYSLGFGTSHLGLVTGMGLEFNNYFFDNDITINETLDTIRVVDLSGLNLKKSKLTTAFLRVPLILEVQLPGTFRDRRAFLSAGIVGALKLGAHTKYVYTEDDEKKKEKNSDDFNINPFRYGITARIGYGHTNIFFDYYLIPMFTDNKGPVLHPFSIGLSLTF